MPVDMKFGCTAGGATHSDAAIPDIATKLQMIKDAGVFDYVDRTPLDDQEFDDIRRASERLDLPVRAGGWFYTLGRDENLFERNIEKARALGSRVHNVQVLTHHADGHVLTDTEIAEFYLRAHEFGAKRGVIPCFEVHVNMWSEHYGRVEKVADLVQARGVPFAMTLDHSHVIFKIDNPVEQEVQGLRADVEAGRVVLDPALPGNVCSRWIAKGYVRHAHARATIPNNPPNIRARHPDGRMGRGIQYPFVKPGPGEYHAEWREERLEPWKSVVRDLLRHAARDPEGRLAQISCEFIPPPDYGGGQGYSIFAQNVACAKWMRAEWAQIAKAEVAKGATQ